MQRRERDRSADLQSGYRQHTHYKSSTTRVKRHIKMFSPVPLDMSLIRHGIRAEKNRRDMPGGRSKQEGLPSKIYLSWSVFLHPLTRGRSEGIANIKGMKKNARQIILFDYALILNYRPLLCVRGTGIVCLLQPALVLHPRIVLIYRSRRERHVDTIQRRNDAIRHRRSAMSVSSLSSLLSKRI